MPFDAVVEEASTGPSILLVERRAPTVLCELAPAALLSAVLVIGLATVADYGITVDEFNADDYGPKALAWYTSGFTDRSHFETVEFSLWYYGPWFHMLTAFVQSFDLADRFTVRHALTFMVGLGRDRCAVADRASRDRALGRSCRHRALPDDRLPLRQPVLHAHRCSVSRRHDMGDPGDPDHDTAGVAIVAGDRRGRPVEGLAIATRTGGIITHAYLLAALILCAAGFFAENGRLPARYLGQLAIRYGASIAVAWLAAIALWPWLQVGNPFEQFTVALAHFASIPMVYEFSHWGERIWTNALPWSFIAGQFAARLPEAFLLLLLIACFTAPSSLRCSRAVSPAGGVFDPRTGWHAAALSLARRRAILVVGVAAILPPAFLIAQRATLYDGVRHLLFVIPMLAVLAGAGLVALLPLLRRVPVIAALVAGGYTGYVVVTLALLHPLEYTAMNAFAGGTRGAHEKFELDYWSIAATEALRRLEHRLDYDPALLRAEAPPSILICIPWREGMVGPMLRRPWAIETDADKADFIIATERWPCADKLSVTLIDEVKRFDRAFARTYMRRAQ